MVMFSGTRLSYLIKKKESRGKTNQLVDKHWYIDLYVKPKLSTLEKVKNGV